MSDAMRTSIAALAWIVTAPGASAVSLTMDTDESVYAVGEAIFLTMHGDTTDGPPANGAWADVVYDDPSLVDGLAAVASQFGAITSFGGFFTWTVSNPACSADGCYVLAQICCQGDAAPDPAIIIGTLVLPTAAAGVLTISTGPRTYWFGAPEPPPVTVTIVPEPSTVQLLALGLLGLTRGARGSGRRRGPSADPARRLAEADGNRTRRERVAALPIGFEVRAGHQHRERFRDPF